MSFWKEVGMRIGRLDIGMAGGVSAWDYNEGRCFCKILDLGPFYITWLSYECLAGMYKERARIYRVKRYLKERKQRPTS